MCSIRVFESDRLNARNPAGPRSAAKSSIDAKSLVIPGEKPVELKALIAEYLGRFQPRAPEECFFVDVLIRDDWQLRRLAKLDAEIWEYELSVASEQPGDSSLGQAFERGERLFESLQHRMVAVQHSYTSALHELQRLQSGRDNEPEARPVPSVIRVS